jgi:hypothetical protein
VAGEGTYTYDNKNSHGAEAHPWPLNSSSNYLTITRRTSTRHCYTAATSDVAVLHNVDCHVNHLEVRLLSLVLYSVGKHTMLSKTSQGINLRLMFALLNKIKPASPPV